MIQVDLIQLVVCICVIVSGAYALGFTIGKISAKINNRPNPED